MLVNRSYRYICFFVALLLHFVTACSPTTGNIEGEHWVIFSAEQANEQGIGSWLVQGETIEYWTPSEENVLALEKGLASYLQENSESFYEQGTPVWERLDDYDRQYIGVILDGKQVIYANYFCDSAQMDWRKNFVFVMDGGDCFFQFKYNTETGEFFDLQVNGMA